jgi:hypothetical protein
MKVNIVLTIAGLAVIILLIIGRFSGGRYGELRPSEEATRAFEDTRINADTQYYLSGSETFPNALMGIDRSWTLETDLWKRRELTADELSGLVGQMRVKAMGQVATPQGFDILDDRGNKIGEWYSQPGMHIAVEMKGERRVSISTPPQDLYPDR